MRKAFQFLILLVCAITVSCATDKPAVLIKESARDYEKLAIEHYNIADYQNALLFFEKALSESASFILLEAFWGCEADRWAAEGIANEAMIPRIKDINRIYPCPCLGLAAHVCWRKAI